jgi:hypothetical protein
MDPQLFTVAPTDVHVPVTQLRRAVVTLAS